MNTNPLVGASLTVVLAACASTPVQVTATTSVDVVPNELAVRDITQARCAREYSCDNIGEDRAWQDYGTCMEDARRNTRDFLVGQRCLNGMNLDNVALCLSAIRNESCGARRGLELIAACSNETLCR